MDEPTRILLADDHALVRRGLRMILDAEPDLTVVAEAADGTEAVAAATAGGVDLAVLDIAMPQMTGIQAARQISRNAPDVRILILSMYDNEQYFFESLRAGASGYVLKSVADRDLIEATAAATGCPTASSRPVRSRLPSSSRRETRPRRSPRSS